MAGFVPFVSSFTAKPRDLIFRKKSGRSRCSVGSPPVTATPSSRPFRRARNEKSSSSGIVGWLSGSSTSEALWQKGQRHGQRAVNTVQAVWPG